MGFLRRADDSVVYSRVMRLMAAVIAIVLSTSVGTAAGQDLRLVSAAAEQDLRTVRALVEQGIDVNTARADGATALLWAAHWNDPVATAVLLRAGANVDAADDHGVTPLARAAENASVAMVQRLLDAGANPNSAQTSGLTPLMTAARTGNLDVVEALMAHGADVNAATTATRGTALMWAVSGSHHEIVRMLLDRGAEPRATTTDGFTPLLLAAADGDIAMAEMLLAAGVDVNETADDTDVLPYAIVSNQDAFALFLLEHGADPNGSMGGISALHAAAGSVGSWLHDWSRRHGGSPSYLGAGIGRGALPADRRAPLVDALLARGALTDARIAASAMFMSYIGYPTKGAFESFSCGTGDVRGATPLWIAAYASSGRGNNTEVLQALLEAGADQHLTTDDGTTPLMAAAGLGRCSFQPREPRGRRSPGTEEAVSVLLEAGADINAVNEADFTALHAAAFRGLNEVVTYLVEQGAAVDARDFRGRTAFRMAEGSKQSFQFQSWPETAALLKELGADTRLGLPGTIQERLRNVPVGADLP